MNMTREEIMNKLTEILKDRGFDTDGITEESKLVDDIGLDSLDLVDLTMDIEDAFSIQIPDEDLPKLDTVGKVVDYILEKVG
jgi:acyl carrier protein